MTATVDANVQTRHQRGAAAVGARPEGHLHPAGRGAVRGRRRRQLRRPPRPDRRPGRRVRLRQVGDSLAIMGLLPSAASASRARSSTAAPTCSTQSREQMRDRRGRDLGMIFQDPLSSLNPVVPIGLQVTEVLERHKGLSRKAATPLAREMLEKVGIPDPDRRLKDYPHQLSGGMRQRALIAMALACEPRLLIADEPTTALDVTIQAQILALLKDLVEDTGTALVMITHDLGVVAGLVDRVNVLYAGRIVERGDRHPLFAAAPPPLHPRAARLDPPARRGRAASASRPSPARCPTTCRGPTRARSRPGARNRSRSAWSGRPSSCEDGPRALRCHNPVEVTR